MPSRLFRPAIVTLIATIILLHKTYAQSGIDSIAKNQESKIYANVENSFNAALGPQSRLYNGINYEFYDRSILGSAYFMDATTENKGTVFYDGFSYRDINLYYDLNKDQVVTFLYKSMIKISLINDKVKSFDLLGHHFIFIRHDPTISNSVNEGFYDDLYDGKIKILAKRSKIIQPDPQLGGKIVYFFTKTSTDYYLLKDGIYNSVNTKGEFMNIFKDRRKAINQFIKENKIKFKKEKEKSMVAIGAYYDHLDN
ncbi:MAG: hypothetical protein ABI203_03995 [Mucilaginibacter sp.]